MKRITFFLSLMLMLVCVGSASAQTNPSYSYRKVASVGEALTNLSDITDGGTYAFLSVGKSKYIKLNGLASLKLNNDASLTADDETDGLAVFTFHKVADAENTYTFETAFSGIYMKPVIDGACYAQETTSPSSFVISTTNVDGAGASEGTFYVKNSENDVWFDMQGDQFVGWQGRDANAGYKIVPITLSEETVTFRRTTVKITCGDEELSNQTSYLKDGTTISYSPIPSYYYTITPPENLVVSETNTEFNYTATLTGTIPVSFSTAESKTWYAIQIMNQGTRTVKAYYDSDDAAWHVMTVPSAFNSTDLADYASFNNAVWSFEQDGTGVKLYNKGQNRYLKWASGFATLESGAANGTTFYFAQNSDYDGSHGEAGFSLWTGSGNQYLNASETKGDVVNARLGVWNNSGSKNDKGSCFRIWNVETNANLLAVGKGYISNTTANEADETYVTSCTAADVSAAVTAAASVTTFAALDAVYDNLNVPAADINADTYYRIVNANTINKKYISSENIFVGTDGNLSSSYAADNSIDRVVRRVTSDGSFVPMLWKLESNGDGTFKIRNANTKCNMSDYVSSGLDMPINVATGGSYLFKAFPSAIFTGNDGKTKFQMLISGHRINAFQGNDNNIICDYGGNFDNDPGNYWQLEKVSSVPVTISSSGYASVGFPFAVQVPASSGVKAYYGRVAEGDVLTLTEIEDGIIPANEGAVLVYEGGTDVNLDIVSTTKNLENKLVAATAKRIGFTADDNYMLGVDATDANKVKFLKATITSVPANKAYLPATNIVNPAAALSFNFGNMTGISDVVNNAEGNVQYFDLNGRRVLYPANGVFVTSEGKKVFIK